MHNEDTLKNEPPASAIFRAALTLSYIYKIALISIVNTILAAGVLSFVFTCPSAYLIP